MDDHKDTKEFGQVVVSYILFLLGIALLFLVFTPLYNYYLNPSFKILSVIAASLLLASGVISILFRLPSIKTTTVFIYLVMISAVTYSVMGTMAIFASAGTNSETFAVARPEASIEEGQEWDLQSAESPDIPPEEGYLPISIPELYLMMGKDTPSYIFEGLTFRGRVVYLDSLNGGEGGYLLSRPAMPCCVADALQIFFPVQMPEAFTAGEFTHLQWIAVAGRLSKKSTEIDEKELEQIVTDTITAFAVIEKDYVFMAEKVQAARPPKRRYVTIFFSKPPFGY
jgi:hypothetical protein